MTKKINYILSLATIAILLASCNVTNVTKLRSGTTMPDDVRLLMTLEDYEFLGETEIEVEYHRYFGLFTYINTINGEAVSNNRNFVYLSGRSPLRLYPRQLNRALYKAYAAYPDADFLMPAMTTKETEQLFLGRKVTAKAKIKSYKIKK
ncbi:MAG: hypothetical protein RJQ00_04255 [Vicingaceae bacterium]